MIPDLNIKQIQKIFFVCMFLCLVSCSKENVSKSDTIKQLTKSPWRFYISRPGDPLIVPTSSYSIYHVPPNVGYFRFIGHQMTFSKDNYINYFPERTHQKYRWKLQGRHDLKVDTYFEGGNTIHEIWSIKEISDTLLDIRVRDIAEPESSEFYWGFKYRRL